MDTTYHSHSRKITIPQEPTDITKFLSEELLWQQTIPDTDKYVLK
ncbi:hypothetical protein [Dolichospermum sp. UHCC 0259]|nr:hypothetical protein [Dolichospermum sp. UHCC 0259]